MIEAFIKSVSGPVSGATVAALLVWAFGLRLAAKWNLWQKRREASLATGLELSKLYGDFFSNWKAWNFAVNKGLSPQYKQSLVEKIVATESGVESLVMVVASQAKLSTAEIETVGKFRQAYQQLREVAQRDKALDWSRSDDEQYVAFKKLSASMFLLVSELDLRKKPEEQEAHAAILEITDNKWEENWTT